MHSHYIYIKSLRGRYGYRRIRLLRFAGEYDDLQFFVLTQTITEKNYEAMSRDRAKLGGARRIWYLYYVIFDHWCRNCVSGGETGLWALLPPIFEIFPVFPNFLRSYVLIRSASRSAARIECFSNRYYVTLYLW